MSKQTKPFIFNEIFVKQLDRINPKNITHKQKKYLQTVYINILELNKNSMSYLTTPHETNYINIQAICGLLELMNILEVSEGFEFLDSFKSIDSFIIKARRIQKKIKSILSKYNEEKFGFKNNIYSKVSYSNTDQLIDLQKYYQYQTHFSSDSPKV